MPYKHLAPEERFLICKLRQAGWSCRQIALNLERDHTTISREIKRNSGKRGYRYKQAEKSAKRRRREASSVPRKMTQERWAMVLCCEPNYVVDNIRSGLSRYRDQKDICRNSFSAFLS